MESLRKVFPRMQLMPAALRSHARTPAATPAPGFVRVSLATALVLVVSVLVAPPPAQARQAPTVAWASSSTRVADTAGAHKVGSAKFSLASGAIYVSTTGSDQNPGTRTKPVRTVARGLALAPTGGQVVLRAGRYHESVTLTRRVTLQNYPGERVWFEGSSAVGSWVKDGTVWRRDGWKTRFDASVGYRKGARDGTQPGWQWINPSYPMAAHPDQVFVGLKALRQVASRSAVRSGTFYLDESTSRLYIGTDPRAGVRASTLTRAITIQASGSVVRGIGVIRYAPSIWHIGSVMVDAPGVLLDELSVVDSATIGIGVTKADVQLRRVSVTRSGLLGIHASQADRLLIERARVATNNVERFNLAPVSGGVKVTRTQGVTVRRSRLLGNHGPGYWSDESTYDTRLVSNNMAGNAGNGVFLEISARALVADNLVTGNAGDGIKVAGTSDVSIWNNTIIRNGRAVNLVQDSRLYDSSTVGRDPRYDDDPKMSWLLSAITVRNNVLGLPDYRSNCVLCVEDFTHQRTGSQIGVTSNGNVFTRSDSATTRWLTVWSRGKEHIDPAAYTKLPAHMSGTAQDRASLWYNGTAVASSSGTLSSSVRSLANSRTAGLPSSIASQVGVSSGTRWSGVFGRR